MNNNSVTLIETYLDGTSKEEDLRQIKTLIQEDKEFRAMFVESCRFNGMLKSASHSDADCEELIKLLDVAAGSKDIRSFEDSIMNSIETKVEIKELSGKPVKIKTGKSSFNSGRKTRRSLRRRKKKPVSHSNTLVWASVAAVLTLAFGLLFAIKNKAPESKLLANVTLSEGKGEIIRQGKTLKVSQVKKLFSGDKYKGSLAGKLSFRYLDGTEISLVNNSQAELILSKTGAKQINLNSGLLKADVVKQPLGKAFGILTSQAQATIVGTAFEIDAQSNSTSLSVSEGRVSFTRLSDSKTVMVKAMQKISTDSETFELSDIAPDKLKILKLSLIYDSLGTIAKGYEEITNGMLIDAAKIPSKQINFTFTTNSKDVDTIKIGYSGPMIEALQRKSEYRPPYSVFGDSFQNISGKVNLEGGRYLLKDLKNGSHTITLTPYKDGLKGEVFRVTFKVINSQ